MKILNFMFIEEIKKFKRNQSVTGTHNYLCFMFFNFLFCISIQQNYELKVVQDSVNCWVIRMPLTIMITDTCYYLNQRFFEVYCIHYMSLSHVLCVIIVCVFGTNLFGTKPLFTFVQIQIVIT